MKSKDQILLEEAYKKVLREQTGNIVSHGFSDKGISSYRYTLIGPSVKLDQQPTHGMFEDDYTTTVYNSLDEAYKELVESLKDDNLPLRKFKKDFAEALKMYSTVVVYSFHKGNSDGNPAATMLVRDEGKWNEVPLDLDEDNVIKEYNTTEEDYNLRTDIPYSEILPSTEEPGNFFNTEKYKEVHDIPITKALKAIITHYEQNLTHQIDACERGECTVGQMKTVKNDDVFIQLLKQGKIKEYNVSGLLDYLYNFTKWFPEHKEEILKLQKHIEQRKLKKKIDKELDKDWNVDLGDF